MEIVLGIAIVFIIFNRILGRKRKLISVEVLYEGGKVLTYRDNLKAKVGDFVEVSWVTKAGQKRTALSRVVAIEKVRLKNKDYKFYKEANRKLSPTDPSIFYKRDGRWDTSIHSNYFGNIVERRVD